MIKKTGLVLLVATIAATPAFAQNQTQNIGGKNIAPNNIGNPAPPPPQPCYGNCYGNGNAGTVIGGVVGGIIGGIIAGSAARKAQRQAQRNPQPIQQQPIQQQPIQPQPIQQGVQVQASNGHSQAHVQWCLGKYKSYRIATNSFTAYSGETRYCNSPFN